MKNEKKIRVRLKALSNTVGLDIEWEEGIHEFVRDFLACFKHQADQGNTKIGVYQLQQNNSQLRTNIESIIDKYKVITPKVYQLRSYFKKLNEDEHFLIFINTDLSQEQSFDAYTFLTALNDNVDFDTVNDQINDLFGELKKHYKLLVFDDQTKSRIGEPDKSKRICRFCGKGSGEVTFKNDAHSISEALGNKKIITNDECDSCNAQFGAGIEHELVQYLDLYRNFFQVRGKTGVPKLKGKNYEIKHDDKLNISHFLSEEEDNDPDRDSFNLRLESHESIALQSIYKALVKYALGVMPADQLERFRETIDWINGMKSISELPKVAILTSYHLFVEHPKLVLSIRKSEDQTLPYAVAEFRFTFLAFVFIIPFSSKDNLNFNKPEDFNHYWKSFNHYSAQDGWNFKNMSDQVKRPFVMKLKFEVSEQE